MVLVQVSALGLVVKSVLDDSLVLVPVLFIFLVRFLVLVWVLFKMSQSQC